MEHSVLGYVLYASMWFNSKFVRVPFFGKSLINKNAVQLT